MDEIDKLKKIIIEKSLNIAPEGEQFLLASGEKSTYFFDMKPTVLDSRGANLISRFILENGGDFQYVGGMETGAIPIVGAVCSLAGHENRNIEGFFIRKKPKERGTRRLIEGNLGKGETLMVEDVTTTGQSVMKAIDMVRAEGGDVKRVITIVDREAGASENLKREGILLVPIFKRQDFNI